MTREICDCGKPKSFCQLRQHLSFPHICFYLYLFLHEVRLFGVHTIIFKMCVVLEVVGIATDVIPLHDGLYFLFHIFYIHLHPQTWRTKPISRLLSPPHWKSKYIHSDKENRKSSLHAWWEQKIRTHSCRGLLNLKTAMNSRFKCV